eukprot:473169-Rhodomonas_salina.5
MSDVILRKCYAMSGTDLAYGVPEDASLLTYSAMLPVLLRAFAFASHATSPARYTRYPPPANPPAPCPVLTSRMPALGPAGSRTRRSPLQLAMTCYRPTDSRVRSTNSVPRIGN